MTFNKEGFNSSILIVTPDFAGPTRNGGIGTACFHQALTLSQAGYPVTILFAGHNEARNPDYWCQHFADSYGWRYVDLNEWCAEHGGFEAQLPPFHGLPEINWSYFALQYMKTRSFDLVFFQDYLSCGLRPMQYKQAGLGFHNTRMILTLHSFHQWIWEGMGLMPGSVSELVRQDAEAGAIRLADRLIAPSHHMAYYTAKNIKGLSQPITVIPYTFETVSETENSARTFEGPFEHLIFFGRLDNRKGLRIFLDAIASSDQLRSRVKRITFLGRQGLFEGKPAKDGVASAMSRVPALEWVIIDELDTHEAIAFVKQQKNALVVAPSLMDNLPLAVIELFVHRIPFITTAVGGIPEIVGAANAHLLSTPTAAALQGCLEVVVGDGYLTIDYRTGYNQQSACSALLSFVDEQLRTVPEKTHEVHRTPPGIPLVSVLVPHFNSTTYLEIALNSLKMQDFKGEYEVIVVDDCSTNPTESERFDRMASQWNDPRVHFVRSDINRGPSGARNFAASKARADWLVFFDCDNEAAPEMLSTMYQSASGSGLDFLTIFTYQILQTDEKHAPKALDYSNITTIYMPLGPALESGAFNNTYGDACAIVRRTAFESVGGFSSKPGSYEDWELFATLCFNGYKMGVIPMPLLYYRNMEAGYSRSTNAHRNLMRILTRYTTPEATSQVNWLEVLKCAHGLSTTTLNSKGRAEASVYNYFSKLNESALAAYLDTAYDDGERSPLTVTLQRMRNALKPLLAKCLTAKKPPRILIYGIGEHTHVLLGTSPLLADYVVGFIDRRPRTSFLGRPCYRPEEVASTICDAIVYSSASFEGQMYDALGHLSVEHVLIYGQ
jgi:glycosyltransferase involved in cell wall biosynthesis